MDFQAKPKLLFVIDGIGAWISAVMLGVVLVQHEELFGIPYATLHFLASIPIFFALYDMLCFRIAKKNIAFLLKVIACLNLLYCLVSIGFALYSMHEIKLLGWIYLFIEILVVFSLARIELKTAKQLVESA